MSHRARHTRDQLRGGQSSRSPPRIGRARSQGTLHTCPYKRRSHCQQAPASRQHEAHDPHEELLTKLAEAYEMIMHQLVDKSARDTRLKGLYVAFSVSQHRKVLVWCKHRHATARRATLPGPEKASVTARRHEHLLQERAVSGHVENGWRSVLEWWVVQS